MFTRLSSTVIWLPSGLQPFWKNWHLPYLQTKCTPRAGDLSLPLSCRLLDAPQAHLGFSGSLPRTSSKTRKLSQGKHL